MYIPPSFVVKEQSTIDQFIENNPFGQLISLHQGQLFSTHIPFWYDAKNSTLTGHMARQNPQHSDLEQQQSLVTLSGAHGYISPTWYAVNSVPTWNYQAVHIYGECQVFSDTDRLQYLVNKLANKFEQHLDDPWVPAYQASMLKAIVGFELHISSIECKYKLNQNRSAADIQGVINHLDPEKQADLIAAMQAALKQKTAVN